MFVLVCGDDVPDRLRVLRVLSEYAMNLDELLPFDDVADHVLQGLIRPGVPETSVH